MAPPDYDTPPPRPALQSVANKGEPFLSGLPPTTAAVQEFLAGCGPWRLSELLGPRDMADRMLPHLAWREDPPPLLAFYSYAAAELTAEAAGQQ
jgi:hypothetical protein